MSFRFKHILVSVALIPLLIGCSLVPFKPFQLDINVKFDDKTASIIGTDSSGKVVVNRQIKKGEKTWQKSMALYSH